MPELQLDLSREEIARIVNFLGYGRLSAPVWFIGIEEGLGEMDAQDALKNLKARASFASTMDLYEAHVRLQESGRPIDIERKRKFTQVWLFMAKIMRAHNEHEDWINPNSAKGYVRLNLGRKTGETFLTELSPIPSGKTSDKKWMTLFRTAEPSLDNGIIQRRKTLKESLKENNPPLVVCYGKRADDFAELLGIEWRTVCPGVSESQNSRHLLLPFFGNGQMSHSLIEYLLHTGRLGTGSKIR